ncbi:MAG: MFS transporter, partial [Dehalococcoidia bacterium]|nr:MFS transporter [Dehalococcoidia bacterium]
MKINNKPDKPISSSLSGRPKEPIFTYNFILASLVNFFSCSSVTVLLATLPIYIFTIGARQSEVGLIIGMFAITALIVRPFAGIAADVWGRRRFMILGCMGMAVSPLLYIIATSTAPLLGVRILQGFTFSVTSTAATALVADISPPLRRGEAVCYYGMSNNMAMAAGPALGVLIMEAIDFNGLFLVSGGLALVSFVLALFVREPILQSRPSFIHRPPLIVRTALFPTLIFYSFTIGAGAVVTFLPLFAVQRGIGNPGLFFTVQALVMVAVRSWT